MPPALDEEDPVARAERAMAELSSEFESWMDSECERLDAARKAVGESGFSQSTRDDLFHAAHDIKGEAATFGYPAVAMVADSLCRLIDLSPDMARIPFTLVEQHVDAMLAIHREHANADAKELTDALIARLREVTDDFLLHENSERPDVIELIKAPSVVPDHDG
jgi:chemotaxis protein histidine kinase CheA